MRWRKTGAPNEDGKYIVAIGYKDTEVTVMNYTVECGWNTSRSSDGEINPETAINNDDGYIKGWKPMPKWSEKC